MAWYEAGTVTVTNGSAVVIGAGTDFIANATIGEAFIGPDLRPYQITQVVSATDLRIKPAYQAGTAGGQSYAIMPTQSAMRVLAAAAAELLQTFAAVRDGVGQGLFPDGAAAAPALRFSADQDTGLYRSAPNQLSVVAGGTTAATATQDAFFVAKRLTTENGATISSGSSEVLDFHANVAGAATIKVRFGSAGNPAPGNAHSYIEAQTLTGSASDLRLGTSGVERMRFDAGGNLLIGVSSASEHTITKGAGQGSAVLRVRSSAAGALDSLVVASVSSYAPNGTGAAVYVGKSTATERSINAGGTINASGADYAEYMVKADGCGPIGKGDVCGVDVDGRLTKRWADSRSFVVKSTDPAYVGGDSWSQMLRPKPEHPAIEPAAPAHPGPMPAAELDTYDEELARWNAASAAYPDQLAAFESAHNAWTLAVAAYEADLSAWEAELEAARQTVDRIAFCGQVPVNVTGDFAVGDYVIVVANGGGIKAVAVAEADITFDQYRRRIGKIWGITQDRRKSVNGQDLLVWPAGMAWVDVQHG